MSQRRLSGVEDPAVGHPSGKGEAPQRLCLRFTSPVSVQRTIEDAATFSGQMRQSSSLSPQLKPQPRPWASPAHGVGSMHVPRGAVTPRPEPLTCSVCELPLNPVGSVSFLLGLMSELESLKPGWRSSLGFRPGPGSNAENQVSCPLVRSAAPTPLWD